MQNPVSKSLSHCSIKILHVIPFFCVYFKCVKCSLWKELEALQHQRSIGMHLLSKHTHSPTPGPPHATLKSTKSGEQGRLPLLTSFVVKMRDVYEREFVRNHSKVKWVQAVMYLVR